VINSGETRSERRKRDRRGKFGSFIADRRRRDALEAVRTSSEFSLQSRASSVCFETKRARARLLSLTGSEMSGINKTKVARIGMIRRGGELSQPIRRRKKKIRWEWGSALRRARICAGKLHMMNRRV